MPSQEHAMITIHIKSLGLMRSRIQQESDILKKWRLLYEDQRTKAWGRGVTMPKGHSPTRLERTLI